MKIIGEKINGTRKTVAAAIANRDAEFIQNLAKKQVEGGAHWLDVNAGTHPDREVDDMLWLIDLIQDVTDVPLSLDSANPESADGGHERGEEDAHDQFDQRRTRSLEQRPADRGAARLRSDRAGDGRQGHSGRCGRAHDRGAQVVRSDARGGRARRESVRRSAGDDDRDQHRSGPITLDTIRAVRAEFPQAHISLGLSNVSFGLPVRSLVNRTFLTLAIAAGMDTAIIDPNDRELKAALFATDLLLG